MATESLPMIFATVNWCCRSGYRSKARNSLSCFKSDATGTNDIGGDMRWHDAALPDDTHENLA
jgi:hypothetical protein